MNRPRFLLFLLFCALGLAIFTRLAFLGSMPGGLNQDEASIGYEAWAILHYGVDRWGLNHPLHLLSWGSGQNALYAYLSMPFIAVFDLTPLSIRLLSACLGLLSLGVVWRLAKRHSPHDSTAPLILALLLATSPWHIMASRWALESNIAPAMLLLGVYFMARWQDAPLRFFPLGAAFIALSVYAYGTCYFFAPLLLLGCALYIARAASPVPLRTKVKAVLLAAVAALVVAAPMILMVANNLMGHGHLTAFGITIPKYMAEARYSAIFLPFAGGGWDAYWQNAQTVFGLLFLAKDDGLSWNAASGWGAQYLWLTPFVLLGIGRSIRQGNGADHLMLIWFGGALLTALLTAANINRINLVWIPSLWLAGVGLLALCHALRRWTAMPPIIASIILGFGLAFSHHYITVGQKTISHDFYLGLDQALARVLKDAPQGPLNITDRSNYASTLFVAKTPPLHYKNTVVMDDVTAPFVTVRHFDRFDFGLRQPLEPQYVGWVVQVSELAAFTPEDCFSITRYGDYAAVTRTASIAPACLNKQQ